MRTNRAITFVVVAFLCIVVIPSLKSGAFVVGADYGRGFASCRSASGWSAPAALPSSSSFGAAAGSSPSMLPRIRITIGPGTRASRTT